MNFSLNLASMVNMVLHWAKWCLYTIIQKQRSRELRSSWVVEILAAQEFPALRLYFRLSVGSSPRDMHNVTLFAWILGSGVKLSWHRRWDFFESPLSVREEWTIFRLLLTLCALPRHFMEQWQRYPSFSMHHFPFIKTALRSKGEEKERIDAISMSRKSLYVYGKNRKSRISWVTLSNCLINQFNFLKIIYFAGWICCRQEIQHIANWTPFKG